VGRDTVRYVRSLRSSAVASHDLARREMLSATRFTSRGLSLGGKVDVGMILSGIGRLTDRRDGSTSVAVTYISRRRRLSTEAHTLLFRVRQSATTATRAAYTTRLHAGRRFGCCPPRLGYSRLVGTVLGVYAWVCESLQLLPH